MTVRTGSCLCGARAYEIEGDLDGVHVCHCSLCRKASGSVGNTILIVPVDRFRWLKGEDHGVTFALRPTYSITRCKTCGTPLPAETDARNVYVTAGTLDVPLATAFAPASSAPRERTGIVTNRTPASRMNFQADADPATAPASPAAGRRRA